MNNKNSEPRPLLEELRKKKGTQEKVAKDFGITGSHLRNLEKGRNDPSTELLFLSALYFGAPVEELWPDIAARAKSKMQEIEVRKA